MTISQFMQESFSELCLIGDPIFKKNLTNFRQRQLDCIFQACLQGVVAHNFPIVGSQNDTPQIRLRQLLGGKMEFSPELTHFVKFCCCTTHCFLDHFNVLWQAFNFYFFLKHFDHALQEELFEKVDILFLVLSDLGEVLADFILNFFNHFKPQLHLRQSHLVDFPALLDLVLDLNGFLPPGEALLIVLSGLVDDLVGFELLFITAFLLDLCFLLPLPFLDA